MTSIIIRAKAHRTEQEKKGHKLPNIPPIKVGRTEARAIAREFLDTIYTSNLVGHNQRDLCDAALNANNGEGDDYALKVWINQQAVFHVRLQYEEGTP